MTLGPRCTPFPLVWIGGRGGVGGGWATGNNAADGAGQGIV